MKRYRIYRPDGSFVGVKAFEQKDREALQRQGYRLEVAAGDGDSAGRTTPDRE